MSISTPLLNRPAQSQPQTMAACVRALRFLVFLFNIVFWIAGLIILGLGLWLLLDPAASDFFALHSAHQGSFRIVAWLLVTAGLILTLTGCCGCCGAWKLNQGALCGFFTVLVIAFVLQLAAAVIAYNRQEHIRSFIEGSMYDTIRNRYSSDTAYKSAMDKIQSELQCCGVKSYSDWLSASWDKRVAGSAAENEDASSRLEHGIGAIGGGRGSGYGRVPSSCCNEHGQQTYPTNCGLSFGHAPLETYNMFMHDKGCAEALYDSVYNHLDIVIFVCVLIGALQLLAMVLSMALCCCIGSNEKRYNY